MLGKICCYCSIWPDGLFVPLMPCDAERNFFLLGDLYLVENKKKKNVVKCGLEYYGCYKRSDATDALLGLCFMEFCFG